MKNQTNDIPKVKTEIAINQRYTLGEEIFSSVSHGVGSLLSIAGLVVLVVCSVVYADVWAVVSSAIYGATLVILYSMSTLYHSITNNKAKKFFRIMDHNTIFLLIAGTYTPITLFILNGALGWTLFGIVWGLTILGIVFNSISLKKARIPSLICYIIMGWVIVVATKEMFISAPPITLWFLLFGGLAYTLGVVFYVIKKVKYFHSIWHIFTIAGSAFHYFAILFAVLN